MGQPSIRVSACATWMIPRCRGNGQVSTPVTVWGQQQLGGGTVACVIADAQASPPLVRALSQGAGLFSQLAAPTPTRPASSNPGYWNSRPAGESRAAHL